MPRKARFFVADVPTHVVQRGNNRQAIFFADNDYRRVKLNSDSWERTGIREIGYCYPMGAGFGPIPMRDPTPPVGGALSRSKQVAE